MTEPKRRGRPPRGEAQTPVAPSRTWEYYQSAHPEPPFPNALNALGAQGWELIMIYTDNDPMRSPTYYAVFKREVVGNMERLRLNAI